MSIVKLLMLVGLISSAQAHDECKDGPKNETLVTVMDKLGAIKKVPCGLKGSIKERLNDCAKLEGSQEGYLSLVARSPEGLEVYRDSISGLLWSDRLPTTMHYYQVQIERKACHPFLKEVVGISDVEWRLPSRKEFERAEVTGIRNVLPNMDSIFWTSTMTRMYADHINAASLYSGLDGKLYANFFRHYYSVRCVAAANVDT